MLTHNLGYPRIGRNRELKAACERYWKGESSAEDLMATAQALRQAHWEVQRETGIDLIPCNDFSLYDHVLDMTVALGAIPSRYQPLASGNRIDLYFAMARGCQREGVDIFAMEMTKWFDTNYHYIVPEFLREQGFCADAAKVVGEFNEARALGIAAKPVLIGPVSYLLLGKEREPGFQRLELMDRLLPAYLQLLQELKEAGATLVQLDEPFLALDLDEGSRSAYRSAYATICRAIPDLQIILATYFEGLRDNAALAVELPVHALHLDLVRAPGQLEEVLAAVPERLSLSLGLVDGRNVWKSDLSATLPLAERAVQSLGEERVLIAPSSSLMHVPYDCSLEDDASVLPSEVREWLSFARQKLDEVKSIAVLAKPGTQSGSGEALARNKALMQKRRSSPLIRRPQVRARLEAVSAQEMKRMSPFSERRRKQQQSLDLPPFPTTTIGSFPQTDEVRRFRSQFSRGKMSEAEYVAALRREIEQTVRLQEEIGLDVLVHGESERNDMVQYFGEQLHGCCFTQNGWVQSFGSRCVKPPVIYGDVERKGVMTLQWSSFAQSLTSKPVKGMLTGPVTILQWSFVRDDQPRRDTAMQIALAVRDEVRDLEQGGMAVIQIDEPAFREGLPLRRSDHDAYLGWAAGCFRLATSVVRDETQIHTHMCYSEFNDIIGSIADLDADVITLEASRSQMDLLEAFKSFRYPNDIGPGVWDIHSPRVPSSEEMLDLLERALQFVPGERLWVNPDCGLKTRGWRETRAALVNMVGAARRLRELHGARRGGDRTGPGL